MEKFDSHEGYDLVPQRTGTFTGMVAIQSGKKLPEKLKGTFTSPGRAKKEIDAYLRSIKPRVSRNAANASD